MVRPEQEEMVSLQEIIALQKRDEAAQKQQELRKEADKVPLGAQGHSSKGKGKEKEKEKGITIREGAPQMEQATVPESTPQLKKDGKRKVEESFEPPHAIR